MRRELKWLLAASAAIGACCLYEQRAIRRHRNFLYPGKVAVITGGSRGLGLILARQLVRRGARVAICSRTEADVQTAVATLQTAGGQALGRVCDVRDPAQVQAFIDDVLAAWNRIDLLFNVAGTMQVGPLDSMTLNDFYDAMQINCWGALHTTLTVLPTMRDQQWGRIVNVASIGGKQAVPHMLPYDASKHALVGLSNGLRTELAKENVLVTTACPTLMRTGSPRNALFKGRHRAEYAWFDIGGSLPFVSVNADRAARQILQACQNGEAEVYIANFLNPPVWAIRCAPSMTLEILAVADRLLPGMGGIGQAAARGFESESFVAPSPLTALGDAAARQNNEMNSTVASHR